MLDQIWQNEKFFQKSSTISKIIALQTKDERTDECELIGHSRFQRKALIRVNILTNSIKGLTSQIVEVLCIVFTFFIISFFARYVWRSLTRNFERGTVSPTLTETPIWMVETVFFIGLTIFLFQMLVTALVVILRKPEES